jgi:hypothetical protein
MTRSRFVPLALSVLILAVALLVGAPGLDAASLGVGAALIGQTANQSRPFIGWNRKREPMKTFTNVAASVTAYSMIPRYPRTVLGFILQLGGTTFTKALIARIELFLGEKSIWGPITGTQLDNINQYVFGERDRSIYFLPIDFTLPSVKEIAGEFIGGLDMTTLPEGQLRLEVEIGAATLPTLRGDVIWGPPQGQGVLGPIMLKLNRRTYPSAPAGDFYPDVDLRGSILCREFWFHDVATAAVSAVSGSGAAFVNTGDGVMGAITVTARTKTGRYRLRVIEPGTNLGTFFVDDPDGRQIGAGVVAAAFSGGGLAFTLADGGTDFVSGDGFTIDVLPLNTDQNVNEVEIRKNEDYWWRRTDRAARFEQERFGRQPLSQLYVADFILDNHIDSVLDTMNAVVLDHRLNVTAAAITTLIAQVLARPVQS